MHSSIAGGRRFAVRSIALQLGATALLAVAWAVAQGLPAALAVGFGGGAVALGNALFALRLFAVRVAPARQVLRGVYTGEALKLGLALPLLYVAIAVLELPFLPLLAGLVLAQIVFWVALVAIR
ncbi:ATP synthase subunit I [Metallibacterium sp.]|nr:ATP synthase subunit I [Metallibacterium sp.]